MDGHCEGRAGRSPLHLGLPPESGGLPPDSIAKKIRPGVGAGPADLRAI